MRFLVGTGSETGWDKRRFRSPLWMLRPEGRLEHLEERLSLMWGRSRSCHPG